MMKILKNNWLIIVLSLFTNSCLVFAINYSLGEKKFEELIPYNLSENYLEFNNSEQKNVQAKEIINFNNFKNLVVIAKIGDLNTVGILDLPMRFYIQATKEIVPSSYRYFSKDDYISQKKVGIVINNCDSSNIDSVKSSKSKYQLDEVINCFKSDVWDYNSINLIQNIYSVDFSATSKVFVDSTDMSEVNTIKNILLTNGFVLVTKNENIPIFNALLDSIQGGKYEQFIVTACISVLIVYILMSFIFSQKYEKYIRISRVVGGEFKLMLKSIIVKTTIVSLILSCLACLIIFHFEDLNTNHLSPLNMLKIQVFMLFCNITLATVNLYINYKRSENLTR